MKRIIRILSVILLILVLFVVGYMCKTCSRLKTNIGLEELEYTSYYSEDYTTTLIISKDYEGEYTVGEDTIVMQFRKYDEGILRFITEDKEYQFTGLENGDLFDVGTKKLLIRRVMNEN